VSWLSTFYFSNYFDLYAIPDPVGMGIFMGDGCDGSMKEFDLRGVNG
jgi:hypothetical protein